MKGDVQNFYKFDIDEYFKTYFICRDRFCRFVDGLRNIQSCRLRTIEGDR